MMMIGVHMFFVYNHSIFVLFLIGFILFPQNPYILTCWFNPFCNCKLYIDCKKFLTLDNNHFECLGCLVKTNDVNIFRLYYCHMLMWYEIHDLWLAMTILFSIHHWHGSTVYLWFSVFVCYREKEREREMPVVNYFEDFFLIFVLWMNECSFFMLIWLIESFFYF